MSSLNARLMLTSAPTSREAGTSRTGLRVSRWGHCSESIVWRMHGKKAGCLRIVDDVGVHFGCHHV